MSGSAERGIGRPRGQVRRWRRLLAEREAALVYRELALRREGEEREILLGLTDAEERHAAYWEAQLGDQAGWAPRPTLRARLMAALARRFGWLFVLALMEQAELRSLAAPDSSVPPAMLADERIHSEVVRHWPRADGRACPARCARPSSCQRRPGEQHRVGSGRHRWRRERPDGAADGAGRAPGRSAVDGGRGVRLGELAA